jgi:bifunctional non-homologous end joining protein LigD
MSAFTSEIVSRTVPVVTELRLTSADRVLFPDDGITKGDLFAYSEQVAPALVPHLRGRPFTLKRYPHCIDGEVYFQKQLPRGAPSWIKTRRFTTHPREGGSRQVDFALVDSPEAVLWAVQMNCIDMNAWYSRVDHPDRPDYVVFDLDPPDEPDRLRRLLERRHPGLVTTEWLKRKRAGVLLDHRQNGWGKTIASVYSVRPKPGAPVSTPLRWEELKPGLRPATSRCGSSSRGSGATATCMRPSWRRRGRSEPRRRSWPGSIPSAVCATMTAMPDWLPPFLAATLAIVLLNVALLEQRRRERRRSWDERLLRELRVWDGLLPEELD